MSAANNTPSSFSHMFVTAAAAVAAVALILILHPFTPTQTAEVWKTYPAPPPLPMPDQTGLAPVDDIQMWYAVFNKGGGNPVLLIHGGLESANTWGNQVPVLVRDHKVIIADSRGHGRSTRSEKRFGYDLMTEDYVKLLDYLMVDKVALVGWSDGGIIGLDMAMRHPERLTKLWAYGANFNVGGLRPNFDKDPVFSQAIQEGGKRYASLSPTPTEYDAFVNQISVMWNSEPDWSPQQLAAITTPTIIVDGEYDEAIKREHTEELARLIPNARLLIMPGVSHFGHLQNPEMYDNYLIGFLNSNER